MYIPGLSRTGSSPSRTVMSFPVYAVSVTALLKRKMPAKQGFCGLGEVYQTARSARAAARLAAAARRTASRSSGSSIAALSEAARASSSGVGRSDAAAARARPRPATGPGPARSAAPAGWRRRARRGACARISSSMRPSSNAQVEDTVVTWSVPSRATRCGHAARAIAGPDRVGPGAGHRGEHSGVGNACAAERAANRCRRGAPSARPAPRRASRRGAARARAAAPPRPSR